MKPRLIVMIGLQASGKSTKARELSNSLNAVVLSSDEYRRIYLESNNQDIFKQLYKDANSYLSLGRNVVIDSTNTTLKMRRQLLQAIKEDCYKTAYIMNVPFEECVERLKKRNEQYTEVHKSVIKHSIGYVPIEALERYHKSFQIPFYEEGFQEIQIDREIPYFKNIENWSKIKPKMDLYDQENIHHKETLGKHMETVSNKLYELFKGNITPDLNVLIDCPHDIGKLFTQTFGEDGQAHYYNHAEVGAYYYITHLGCYDLSVNTQPSRTIISSASYNIENSLLSAFYINYHMLPFNWQSEKARAKWKSIFGEEKFNNLVLFNKCDTGEVKYD